MSDHEEIYLEPLFEPDNPNEQDWYDADGRAWCQDDVWCEHDYHGVKATKYIRSDIIDKRSNQIKTDAINDFVCIMIGALECGFVEFCETAFGGSKSPKTLAALKALSDAIKEDNESCPEFAGHIND